MEQHRLVSCILAGHIEIRQKANTGSAGRISMKGDRSRNSEAHKQARTLTKEERDARQREALQERQRLRDEMAQKRRER